MARMKFPIRIWHAQELRSCPFILKAVLCPAVRCTYVSWNVDDNDDDEFNKKIKVPSKISTFLFH